MVGDADIAAFKHGFGVALQRVGAAFGFGRQQTPRVGVLRVGEHGFGRSFFAHKAVLHDVDVVSELAHHGQIMGDQDHRHAVLLLQGFDQVQNLGLHCYIQRGGGFICDQHIGVVGKGHGDHHPLALPAGKLVRILPDAGLGVGDLHLGQ
ncbi:MAG: hypothetical protein ACD_54C00122G0003 [uncultured bacterium]|nr:MAG: hypothetical protein ACD_54C00122G0003 [uncultured bacterium]